VLLEFIGTHRDAIIDRTHAQHGIPVFLDKICDALRRAPTSDLVDSEQLGKSRSDRADDPRIGPSIAQLIHDYGDVCQAITVMAGENDVAISSEEFRTLDHCLDVAIAHAITEYERAR
jgi:hypothetical protein